MIQIVNEFGYIVDRATREAYDRIIMRSGTRSAEAFLRLVARFAAKGIRLMPRKERVS